MIEYDSDNTPNNVKAHDRNSNNIGKSYRTYMYKLHYKIEGFSLTHFVSYKGKDRHEWSIGVRLLDGDRASTCEAIQSVK